MTVATNFGTQAWLLQGINSIPGVMKLEDGRLSFTAVGCGTFGSGSLRELAARLGKQVAAEQLENGEEALLFDVPLAEVRDIHFPWYYFSGGVKLSVHGVGLRFGFDRPANTTVPDYVEESMENLVGGIESIAEITRARKSGKVWKELLTAVEHR